MQIHEITKHSLNEGILKTIGQDIKGAVTEPFQKLQAIAKTPGAWTSATKAGAALDQRERAQADQDIAQQQQQRATQVAQQTQQRAKELSQQWAQQLKTKVPTSPVPAAGSASATAVSKVASTPTVTIGSVGQLTKGDGGRWYNEKGQPVTDPAQAAKIDKAYQDQEFRKKQFQQTAMVREIAVDPQRTAARRAQRAQARKSPTGQTPATSNDPMEFVSWADAQLATVISGTKQPINMDMVRKNTALATPVKTALDRVLKNPADTNAVEEYFETAMQAMQQLSAQIKQSSRVGRVGAGIGGNKGLLNQIMSDRQLEDLKGMIQNPSMQQKIKSELGIR